MKQLELITALKKRAGAQELQFSSADTYYWSPKNETVYYQAADRSQVGLWTLLHETCHGLLEHKNYASDFELINLEVDAWEKAVSLGNELGLTIDDDHIQNCLDSYRDWQYKRSLCPYCNLGGIQINTITYTCLFCDRNWRVSTARFCRPYRRKT